jgi:branched-chain amino acid transport system ATP-binding protein
MSLLQVSDLTVRYGRVAALRDITFEVNQGEAVAIVGPNGAGKSTLLAAIMRMVGWSSGDVNWQGRSLAGSRSDQVARGGIALVPEGRQIFANLTVRENLRLGLVARPDRSSAAVAAAFDEVHRMFPIINEFSERPAGLMSGGQQQQLAIARALVADPQLLLLDEPSLGLAPTVIDAVFEALDVVRASGRTILLVEQRAQRAIAFADRTLVLAGGQVRSTIGPRDATNAELLRRAYFGAESAADGVGDVGGRS